MYFKEKINQVLLIKKKLYFCSPKKKGIFY